MWTSRHSWKSFNLCTKRMRGRAPLRQPAARQLQFECGRNLNLVLAAPPDVGMIYYKLERGSINGEQFQHFIDNLHAILEEQEFGILVIVLDNVHNSIMCKTTNKKLPASLPFLNTIENCFSAFK